MANQKGQFIGKLVSGESATQQITAVDSDLGDATFTQRGARTAITFKEDTVWDDLTLVANLATATRMALVLDGDVLNKYSALTVIAAAPATSKKEDRWASGPVRVPLGTEIGLRAFVS